MMNWFPKRGARDEQVFQRLLDSPLARQAAADEESARLARRRQLTAELAELRAPHPRLAELRAAEDSVRTKLEAAQRLVSKCKSELAQIGAEALGVSCARDHQVRQREAELRRTAHPGLDLFRQDALSRANAARLHVQVGEFTTSPETIFGGRKEIPPASNVASVASVTTALRAAVAEVEALQLAVTPDAQIEARLEALRKALHVPDEPEPLPGESRPWRDETRMQFPEIGPALRQTGSVFTPAELREARWRAEEAKR